MSEPDARDGARRARRGRGSLRGPRYLRAGRERNRRAAAHRHGVPTADALSDDVRSRQRRRRSQSPAARRASVASRERRRRRACAAPRRAVGRGEGPAARQRCRAIGRPATAPLHRPRARHDAVGAPARRTDGVARSDQHPARRGARLRAQARGHDHHRHPQHAAGGAHLGPYGIHAVRRAGRGGRHERHVNRSSRFAHRSLHHGPVRMTATLPAPDVRAAPVERGLVRADRFSFWYGEKQALFEISMTAGPKSVTALIGPSGCGKSTFLRSINRMNALLPGVRHEGTIRLDDTDVYSGDMDGMTLRRRVGMVFQRWNPFPKSIYENVAYGPKINGIRKRADLDAIVESALHRSALWDEVKDRLRQSALSLSGGQQQRLCIARALANDPEVLLLDEPASALDPVATQKVEELLYELKRELTIVIVTHNMQQAARVSEFTAFFYVGELVEAGPTDQIFTSPLKPRTEAYITGRFG